VLLGDVTIQGYRSLYDVTLTPGSFKALVGPNNAGKTNLADALQFIGDIARSGLEVAVGKQGGYENLAFRRQRRRRRPLKIAFSATIHGHDFRRPRIVERGQRDNEFQFYYSFDLRASSESRDADFRVSDELLAIGINDRPFVSVQRHGDEVLYEFNYAIDDDSLEAQIQPLDDPHFWDYVQDVVGPTELMLSRLSFSALAEALLTVLGKTRLFQLSPVECRKPGAWTPSPELGRHGANLPAVVRYLRASDATAWDATMRAMRRIMPSLSAIHTEFTPDRQLALTFEEAGARRWTANEVSDGTIQSLGLFTCLFDSRLPLVAIEEPENSVHPWIVRAFVDACREAKDKQVLVTTHSPALIAYLKPDELAVMWRTDDGQSHVCPLELIDPEAKALWSRGEVDLFELIDGGWIRESVPPGLQ
jgi:predicted ATPase